MRCTWAWKYITANGILDKNSRRALQMKEQKTAELRLKIIFQCKILWIKHPVRFRSALHPQSRQADQWPCEVLLPCGKKIRKWEKDRLLECYLMSKGTFSSQNRRRCRETSCKSWSCRSLEKRAMLPDEQPCNSRLSTVDEKVADKIKDWIWAIPTGPIECAWQTP